MDLTEFRVHVREVLEHLHDCAFLETHALVLLGTEPRANEVRGRALQKALLDAIQALKPPPDVPYDSLAWRKYRYLYLRYVQDLPTPEIASDLGISLRQSRRYSLEGLSAVALILWDRQREALAKGGGPVPRSAPPASEMVRSAVDQEMARMEQACRGMSTNTGELLASVAATIRPLAERRGIVLRSLVSGDSPVAAIERTVLRQALLSVLSLSIETGPEVISLSVESGPADAEAGDADTRVIVRFQPRGSPEETAEQLLGDERWHIARQLLEAQGAHVNAAPPQGDEHGSNGSDVTVVVRMLPVRELRALIVEDNSDVVQLYRRYLADTPYRVLVASSGKQAIEFAEAERPSVIVLDVMIPSQDGWEILQVLKGNPATQDVPVVICSVLRERDLALALGAADLLVKPVARADLLQALDRHARL